MNKAAEKGCREVARHKTEMQLLVIKRWYESREAKEKPDCLKSSRQKQIWK